MHPSEDVLRAYLDGELDDRSSVSDHLKECNECSQSYSAMHERSNLVHQKLETLEATENHLSPDVLLARVRERQMQKKTPLFSRRMKPVWASAAALLFVLVAWQFSAVRVWAAEFLNLFRVQQIAVVPIDPANVRQFDKSFFDAPENRPRLEQLFSDEVNMIKHGTPQVVASVNDAAKVAGFGVRLPAQISGDLKLKTQPAVDVSVRIEVEKLQSVLNDAGRSDIQVPEELDGQSVNFHIPASVTAFYGKCPDLAAEKQREDSEDRSRLQQYPDCKVLIQLPSPSVVAPPSMNVSQVGQAMLQLFGLPEAEARKFAEKIDWSSTLVIPLPLERRMKFSDVQVDGVSGTLFSSQRYGQQLTAYNLLWIRDGILYSIMGQGKPEDAVAIANSLQ